jgi:hypothetical protein
MLSFEVRFYCNESKKGYRMLYLWRHRTCEDTWRHRFHNMNNVGLNRVQLEDDPKSLQKLKNVLQKNNNTLLKLITGVENRRKDVHFYSG